MSDIESRSGRACRDQDLFNRVADRYAAKDLQPAMRIARRRRVEATWSQVGLPSVGHLLEIGCGAGYGARYLAGYYRTYTGVDYSSELISRAKALNHFASAIFVEADATTFAPAQSPDVILAVGVFHHLAEPGSALKHAFAILRPGGVIVANEPQSRNPVWEAARAIRSRFDSAFSEEQRPYGRGELEDCVRRVGFEKVTSVGQGLLSTPLSEIRLPFQPALCTFSRLAVRLDALLERRLPMLMRAVAWNVIVVGRKPPSHKVEDGSQVGSSPEC